MAHLLSHVETKMHCDLLHCRWQTCIDGGTIYSEGVRQRLLYNGFIVGSLLGGQKKVRFSILKHLLMKVSDVSIF